MWSLFAHTLLLFTALHQSIFSSCLFSAYQVHRSKLHMWVMPTVQSGASAHARVVDVRCAQKKRNGRRHALSSRPTIWADTSQVSKYRWLGNVRASRFLLSNPARNPAVRTGMNVRAGGTALISISVVVVKLRGVIVNACVITWT